MLTAPEASPQQLWQSILQFLKVLAKVNYKIGPCDPEFLKSALDKLSNESIDRKNKVRDCPASGQTGHGVTGG